MLPYRGFQAAGLGTGRRLLAAKRQKGHSRRSAAGAGCNLAFRQICILRWRPLLRDRFASFRRLAATAFVALGLLPQAASAQVPTPQELLRLAPLGAYLAARHAGADRDAAAAAAYYRAALRADPNNKELLDRAFLSLLAGGDVEEAVRLAEKIVVTDKTDRIARLALGVRAIKQKQYPDRAAAPGAVGARSDHRSRGDAALAGWASYGANEARGAVESIDKLAGPDWYGLFKDMHAGLILELSGNKKEAGKRLERAHKLDPSDMRAGGGLCRLVRAQRREG